MAKLQLSAKCDVGNLIVFKFWDFFGNSLIFFFWNCLRIHWELFGNSLGIVWECIETSLGRFRPNGEEGSLNP